MNYHDLKRHLLPGDDVAAFAAGLRRAALELNPRNVSEYGKGRALASKLPRRVAKKWATRLVSDVNERRLHDNAQIRAAVYIASRDAIETNGGTRHAHAVVRFCNSYRALRRALKQ